LIRKPKISKNFAILFAVIATVLLSLFSTISASSQLTLTDDNGQSKTPVAVDSNAPATKSAGPESQFQVEIAYAYVGPLPLDKASYFSKSFNQTMVATSKFPSAVFLNFIRVPSVQISSCDAVIQVYGVKIAADTGPTEYHAWSAGMNYTALTQEEFGMLIRNADNLVDRNLYRSIGGTFHNMWAADQSILSQKIGSVGEYTGNHTNSQPNIFDLSSAGMPNKISVEVRRIGYVTITNGSVNVYKDAITVNKSVAYAQLSKYEDGFIYNNIVPAEKLTQIDLFHPQR
jgi:hypothetical protein